MMLLLPCTRASGYPAGLVLDLVALEEDLSAVLAGAAASAGIVQALEGGALRGALENEAGGITVGVKWTDICI